MAEEEKFVPKYIRQQISADKILLTFTKSGNTYQFTPSMVAQQQAKAFRNVQQAGMVKVTAALKAKLEDLYQQEGSEVPAYKPIIDIIAVCDIDGDLDDMAAKYAETVFGEMSDKWKDAPLGESEEYNELAEGLFTKSIEDTIYDQNMRKLDTSNKDEVVLVEDCIDAGPQYFYADSQYANGRQIWRKALNPFLWYGVKT